ncbi:MAG: HU family DNA-binding protein [Paludibacteraceae bacterium]|nr:HU family DNA-binding protein [Bacteroidales bacterium]
MTQKELISETAKSLDMTKVQTEQLLNATSELIVQALLDGKSVMIQNFGTLEVKQKNERVTVHPKTGVRTLTPPKLQVNFKANPNLKEELKNA